jgi:PAS domain S-box-containing protein
MWVYGQKHKNISTNGWTIIIVGFTLLTFGFVMDTSSETELFETYIEDTIFEDLFDKIFGQILAFSLLGIGLVKWMPSLANVDDLKKESIERKNMEKELSKKNSLLSGLLNSIPDAIFFKDNNGAYLGCNPAFSKLLNRPEEMVKGKKDRDLFSNEITSLFQEQDKKTLETGTINEFNSWVNDSYYDTIKAPLHTTEGELIGILGISRDITSRKNAEEEMIKAKIDAEMSNRTKSEFLAVVSHELRTPLNIIIGFSDILLEIDDAKLDEKYKSYIQSISTSGYQLLSTVNNILDISRLEAGKMDMNVENFDIDELFNEVTLLIDSHVAQKNIFMDSSVNAELPAINADKIKVKQILYNLIGNAVKFTPEGGKITMSAMRAGPMIRVEVADTGIGISRENQELLFQPFVQIESALNRTYGGTGLGLSIVKNYLDMHNGNIWVESELGKGSTFVFEIPIEANIRSEMKFSLSNN